MVYVPVNPEPRLRTRFINKTELQHGFWYLCFLDRYQASKFGKYIRKYNGFHLIGDGDLDLRTYSKKLTSANANRDRRGKLVTPAVLITDSKHIETLEKYYAKAKKQCKKKVIKTISGRYALV